MYFLWQQAEKNMPKKDNKGEAKPEVLTDDQKNKILEQADKAAQKKNEETKLAAAKRADALTAAGGGLGAAFEPTPPKPPEPPKINPSPPAPPPPPPEKPTLIAMGDNSYYVRVLLSTRGGGVQQIVLPQFGEADRLGREVKEKDANGQPTKVTVPLFLVPGVVTPRGKFLREEYRVPPLKEGKVTDTTDLAEPSYTLFHYPTEKDTNPDPMLGERNWKVVSEEHPQGGEHKVIFEAELGEPYFQYLR
jgi:hypothetical protein